jgi:hypothetical protein
MSCRTILDQIVSEVRAEGVLQAGAVCREAGGERIWVVVHLHLMHRGVQRRQAAVGTHDASVEVRGEEVVATERAAARGGSWEN